MSPQEYIQVVSLGPWEWELMWKQGLGDIVNLRILRSPRIEDGPWIQRLVSFSEKGEEDSRHRDTQRGAPYEDGGTCKLRGTKVI